MTAVPAAGLAAAVTGGSVSEDERLARVALARVVEPGSRAVHEALKRAPATEVWAALRAGVPLDRFGQQALDGIVHRAHGYDPHRDVAAMLALGGRVLCPGDEEWPDGLDWPTESLTGDVKEMAPPWVLFVRGPHSLRTVAWPSVALVGARAATAYGEHVASTLAFGLTEAGMSVVSGAAYGIDGAAHRGALTAQGVPTIAVLACGVDIAYPRGHDRLLGQILQQGLVVSEVPPGSAPTRIRFLVRNRLIAALSRGTVVVEAALRSGSLSTAGRAAELGRKVMAVPGPVTSIQSAGCHKLIRDSHTCVTSVAEVLEVLGAAGEHLAPLLRGPSDPRDGLSETLRRVLDAVPVRSAVGVARIASSAGVSTLVVQQVLPPLLVAGLVEQQDGGWRLTALGASGPAPQR